MLDGLASLPVDTYAPWSFIFAAALLASGVDALARRPFNPVVLAIWFFGIAFSAATGGWGVSQVGAALICLATPHLLLCSFAPRLSQAGASGAEPASFDEPGTTDDTNARRRLRLAEPPATDGAETAPPLRQAA